MNTLDEVPAYLRKIIQPETTEPEAEPPTADAPDERTRLFLEYQEAEELLAEAEAAVEFCKNELCEKSKAIFDTLGPGPFEWQGRHMRFVQRKGRGGADTYYARRVNPEEKE